MITLPKDLSPAAVSSARMIERDFPLVTAAAPPGIWTTLPRKYNGGQYGPSLRVQLPLMEAALKAGTLPKAAVGSMLWNLCGRGASPEEQHNIGKKKAEQIAGKEGGEVATDAAKFKAREFARRLDAAVEAAKTAPKTAPVKGHGKKAQ